MGDTNYYPSNPDINVSGVMDVKIKSEPELLEKSQTAWLQDHDHHCEPKLELDLKSEISTDVVNATTIFIKQEINELHHCTNLHQEKLDPESDNNTEDKTLIPHTNSVGDKLSVEEPKTCFQCSVCAYTFFSVCHLNEHEKTHTVNKRFACTFSTCYYKCNAKSDLKRHLRVHTGEKPYKCDICDYRCKVKAALNQHFKIHTGEKQFNCKLCGYKTAYKATLNRHSRIHSEKTPLKCSLCDFKCKQKTELSLHMSVHTGNKPFCCNICDYKSVRESYLLNHMMRHAGEKPFKCSFCDYRCVEKIQLNQHLRVHTGEKPYVCNYCDYKASQKANLNRHIKRNHIKGKNKSYRDLKVTLEDNDVKVPIKELKEEKLEDSVENSSKLFEFVNVEEEVLNK